MKTENKPVQSEDKDLVERVILGMSIFYTIIVLAATLMFGWSLVVAGVLVAILPVNVYLYVNKAASYRARACFMTTALWFSLTVYGLSISDFIGMLTSLVMVVIVLAYYGLPEVFYIGNFFYTVLVAAHLFLLRDITLDPGNKGVRTLIRILTVYLIQTVAWKFVMGQQERNKRQLDLIESLRRAEQSKDDFLANVSHEIRTPVNTICGMSEIVLQNDLPGDVRNYVFGIQTAGRNLLAAVSDVLDFSELQSGKMGIIEDEYSITSVVNDIINIANAKNSHKSLELVVDCDSAIPALLIGDRQKISRAIQNVMDNAIKFTEAGGVVLSLTARKESYGVNLCVTVKDTGIGIRPEDLERIFTSFNQADTRRNRADGGIGLGLAISRTIVEKMGGFIHVSSTYGEGTQVSMVIPQKVADETPCIVVRHPEEADILIYLKVDKYTFPLIRDGSRISMERMAARFGVSACFCRNIAEVRRRMQNQAVTHLFVGWEEYCEDRAYFEEAAGNVQTILIVDRKYQHEVADSQLLCIYAPVYALAIASILNGETVHDVSAGIHRNRFTAPDVHVLVVDDNMMNLKVVEGLLRPYKLKVTVAQSGREALKKVESKAFDFIFMDHMMPEMDGVETFRRIRERPDSYSQKVPIIALTANAVGNAREMFLAEGFSDYISKPIEMSALEHVLRKFIPKDKMVYAGREIQIFRPRAGAASAAEGQNTGGGAGLTDYGRNGAGSAETGTGIGGNGAGNAGAGNGTGGSGAARDGSQGSVRANGSGGGQGCPGAGAGLGIGTSGCVGAAGGRSAGGENAGASGRDSGELEPLRAAGIDTAMGLTYCGGAETDYLEILRIYCRDGEKNVRLTKKAVAEADWKQFVILTHTLKSTSNSIGAVRLSGLAKALEADGKAGKLEQVEERTGELLAEYTRVLQALRECPAVFPQEREEAAGESAKGPAGSGGADGEPSGAAAGREAAAAKKPGFELSPEEFSGRCARLREIIGSFDGDAVAEYVGTLKGQHYHGRELAILFGPVCERAEEFDFMGAEEALADVCRGEGIA